MVVQVDPGLEHVVHTGLVHHAGDHARGRGRVQPAVAQTQDDVTQREVHHPVHGREPLARVVGQLAHHQRTGLFLVRGVGEFLQEAEADVEGHVQAPAVHAVAQVTAHHGVASRVEVLAHRRVLQIQLGQVLGAPPGARAAGELIAKDEPVAPGAGRIGLRQTEGRRVAPHVVEHAVQHQLQAACVQVLGQALDILARAVLGRDVQVVQRVVLVVGVGQADGVEVQHVGAQLDHVVQACCGAGEVAAPEVDLVAPELVVLEVLALGGHFVPAAQALGRRVKVLLGSQVCAGGEAVHQHLVDHGAIAPVGLAGLVDAGHGTVESVGVVHGVIPSRPLR